MNERQLTERITNMIDESAPAVSVEQVIAHSHAGAVRRPRQPNPKLVIAFSASLAVLIAAVVVVGVALRSGDSNPSPAGTLGQGVYGHLSPLPDTSLAPAGWAPYEFGDVQVSVPDTWSELEGFTCPGPASLGETKSNDPGCRTAYVTMTFSSKRALPHAHRTVVNGIAVMLGSSGNGDTAIYMERVLDVEIHADGSIAQQILATITYSSLSLVLDSDVHGTPAG